MRQLFPVPASPIDKILMRIHFLACKVLESESRGGGGGCAEKIATITAPELWLGAAFAAPLGWHNLGKESF
jgi:hypothetical protein